MWAHGRVPSGKDTTNTAKLGIGLVLMLKYFNMFLSLWPYIYLASRAQHFPSNLYPYRDHNHQQRPMPTHAYPCPPIAWHMPTHVHTMLFKLRPCIQKLCNVYYMPTSSLSWIGQIKGHSLSLASTQSVPWLANYLHLRSLTPIWRWM
jgi:hypothetical protein